MHRSPVKDGLEIFFDKTAMRLPPRYDLSFFNCQQWLSSVRENSKQTTNVNLDRRTYNRPNAVSRVREHVQGIMLGLYEQYNSQPIRIIILLLPLILNTTMFCESTDESGSKTRAIFVLISGFLYFYIP